MLKLMIMVILVKMVLKLSYIFFVCVKNCTSLEGFQLAYIYRTTKKDFGFYVINIILGEIPLTPNNGVENFIILSGKQYIFSCLFPNRIPSLCGLLCHIKMKYCIERCVFMPNSKQSMACIEKNVWFKT